MLISLNWLDYRKFSIIVRPVSFHILFLFSSFYFTSVIESLLLYSVSQASDFFKLSVREIEHRSNIYCIAKKKTYHIIADDDIKSGWGHLNETLVDLPKIYAYTFDRWIDFWIIFEFRFTFTLCIPDSIGAFRKSHNEHESHDNIHIIWNKSVNT